MITKPSPRPYGVDFHVRVGHTSHTHTHTFGHTKQFHSDCVRFVSNAWKRIKTEKYSKMSCRNGEDSEERGEECGYGTP